MKFIQKVERKDVPRYSEYAGMEERYDLHPCEVQVKHTGRGTYWFLAQVKATRTHYHFQNRIGATLGRYEVDDTPKETTYCVQMDSYDVGTRVLEGAVAIEEGDGWELHICGEYSDGRPMAQVRHIDPSKRYAGV